MIMSIPDGIQALAIYGGSFLLAISPMAGIELYRNWKGRRSVERIIVDHVISTEKVPPYSKDPDGDRIVRKALTRFGYDPDNPQLGIYQR